MNALTLDLHKSRFTWPVWREHCFALGVAVALHIGLAFVLLNLSHNAPMPPVVSSVITTQLLSLPAPAVQPPPPPVAAPMPTVAAPEPAPIPEPVVKAPQVQQADLALKRVQQERQEKERQQRIERDRQQQRREEALRQEQIVREEQQRQARLQEQQFAQARQAEAERQAAAAAARAEAAVAASRQYLPIAKDAPDYPQRALDRKIEGECTVAYRVTAQGRVEDPQVVDACHPLFVKPSLAAAKSFRYQPKVVNGQAVAVANVKNTFTYKIQ
ncbi:energy transducer TonB [Pseudomonas chlororaphis]|uniref:energy transducer TonB n=1 Tax=Pseudomonas chlororaphis TaxID=587753 RepID=UPI001B30872D|nr:energy transducer TonB [Pseudomonas chlororaphis]MBP5059953.1 TonB family protein [Pseudomonas chlororaphis]MBP5142783.1 TonB family protein [Pseudomonas chlororaphis]QTT98247.1 TonB family protein [Pseudomonas chlororaphis]